MKLMHKVSGHLFTIALAAGAVACSHAQPKPDESALKQQPAQTKPVEAATPTATEAYHAQG